MTGGSPPKVLLVDGNNVIHAWPELLELHRRRKENARDLLCRDLAILQDTDFARVAVVFDGRGSKIESVAGPGQVQVFFSDAAHSADSVIERLATKYAARFDVQVATDDRAIQNHAEAAGAQWFSTSSLRDRIDRANRNLRDRFGIQ